MPTARRRICILESIQLLAQSIPYRCWSIARRRNMWRQKPIRRQPRKSADAFTRRESLPLKPRRARQQLPQYIWQDSTMQVVVNLDRSVDAQDDGNFVRTPVRTMNDQRDILARFYFSAFQTGDIEGFRAIQIQ